MYGIGFELGKKHLFALFWGEKYWFVEYISGYHFYDFNKICKIIWS